MEWKTRNGMEGKEWNERQGMEWEARNGMEDKEWTGRNKMEWNPLTSALSFLVEGRFIND